MLGLSPPKAGKKPVLLKTSGCTPSPKPCDRGSARSQGWEGTDLDTHKASGQWWPHQLEWVFLLEPSPFLKPLGGVRPKWNSSKGGAEGGSTDPPARCLCRLPATDTRGGLALGVDSGRGQRQCCKAGCGLAFLVPDKQPCRGDQLSQASNPLPRLFARSLRLSQGSQLQTPGLS